MGDILEIKTRVCRVHDEQRIALIFSYNAAIIELIKNIEGRKWSASHKFWHIPYSKNTIQQLNKQFKGKLEFIPEAYTTEFPAEYLETLQLKNYSDATIKTYRLHSLRFLKHLPETDLKDITKEKIRQYLLYLVQEKHYATSAQNQAINSIKFYYEKVLGKPVEKYYVPLPRKEKKLPEVLSEEEVTRILMQIKNLKHKCIIYLFYSAGLRLTEVVHLRIADIHSDRKQIFIRSAKGNKDRYGILSDTVIELLREYYKKYKPQYWLFEGRPGEQFSRRSIQDLFKKQ